MKNMWPKEFKPNEVKPPKKILDEQSKLLPNLTGDMVYAEIKAMGTVDSIMKGHENDFNYSYYLIGKFLKDYSFKLFDFSHSITMYPVKVTIDEEMAKEFNAEQSMHLDNEEEFINLVGSIFNSGRVKSIIGSIIQISGAK